MNCRHDTRNDSTPGFNHGFFDSGTCTRTIMTYPNGCSKGRILQYSNILNTFNGNAIGDAATQNNGRAITERAQTMRNFRAAKVIRVSWAWCDTYINNIYYQYPPDTSVMIPKTNR